MNMCSFLSQNRHFVDVCQCPKIAKDTLQEHIPSNVKMCLEPEAQVRVEWG